MTVTGYSDRVNHAFAFAAKHHDQQVRKGTRLPYFTQPANVAVILTRYNQNDAVVVGGILHDTIQDAVREGWNAEMLDERIGHKFGSDVLELVLSVTERRIDDDGIELSVDDRKSDLIERLANANELALWIFAADKVHNANTILFDLSRTSFPETIWARFSAGKERTVSWYKQVSTRLREVGFAAAIVDELEAAVHALEQTDAKV